MKLPVRLCFLHLFITLAWTETNKTTGLQKRLAIELQNQTGAVKLGKFTSRSDQGSLRRANTGGGKEALGISDDSKTWTSEHRKNHLFTINGGKRTPCQGKSCSRRREVKVSKKTKLRNKVHRHRRTNSVFLVKALDLLNHSKARELWNFVTRATPDKPYKQFSNGTGGSDKSTNGATNRTSQPARNQPGSKRQEWSDLEREMRPRFFFNSAPAEYVEQKPPPAQTPNEGTTHLRQGPIRVHGPFNGNGPVPFIHGENNHLHLLKHPGHLTPLPINVFGHPPPNHLVSPLTFHNHHAHMHHFAPPPPYAIHIDAPPKLEPPIPPDVIPPPIPPMEVPPSISPEVLGDQIPPAGPPMKGPPLLQDVPIIPPPDGAMINHPPIDSPLTNEGIPPEYSMMPPPDAPVPQQPIDIQGMPPPGVVSPIPPPFPIQKVPVPVPVPSPPKVEHVPYPVPVPGPPSIQQVMVPVRVPSPPKIEEVPVPVPSPPKIRNVPVPFPVPVPSPPRLQRVPYPVPVPVKEPPEIHRVFLPVAVPQPSSVRHVPYPVYIRYPPEIKRVPFPVPAPPQPIPVPVPSPPRLMVHRIPFPVMYPQKVPFPVPVVINHHLMHQSADHTEESSINGQCLVNLCLNGGTCSAYMNSYRCHCPNGFQGAHCEEQNLCLPNPCRNFGVCSRVEHDYECTCSKGFIGRNCDKPDPCVPSPCENGATCSSDGNSYSCSCRVGWMGKNCQVESKCLPLNPCQNGGTCTEAQGAYKCECTPGWTGLSCEVGCDNCPTPDEHFLEEIKRNKLRNKMASVKKGTVTKSYKL